jgi:hypothetical protein
MPWFGVGTWHDPDLSRPIAAPLERCAELLGVDLATVGELATKVEPYVRVDGTRIWSLMQLERQLRPEAYGRRRGGYLDRRQPQPPTIASAACPWRLWVMSHLSTIPLGTRPSRSQPINWALG